MSAPGTAAAGAGDAPRARSRRLQPVSAQDSGTQNGGTQDGGAGPLATVVIVNWNGAHLLPACLDGTAKQVTDFAFETWVVDNASRDSSRTLLAERYPSVRLVPSEVNLGFAGGNNLALRMITTPYAVLLNNDAVPEPDWLANLLAPFTAAGGEQLGAVTGKVVFLPRFLRLRLSTATFTPGPHDSRALGVRISSVTVNGREVLREVLWEKLTFGAEGGAAAPFFWTRGDGELCVPVPEGGPVTLGFTWSSEAPKPVTLSWDGGSATLATDTEPSTVELAVPSDVTRVDVINNVGGIVLRDGYGADRGYQQIDSGQFAEAEEVFTACGNGMAIRTELGRELGWFDDDFFLYYEDTDLSWRIRAHGHTIRYVPAAVVRHVHSASSVEWSPLFVFHTDRNRLLMLTKNASARIAVGAVGRYPLTTASMAIRAVRQAWAARSRPALRPTILRLTVMASYLRLLPVMLGRRRAITRTAAVGHRELETWLASR
ncbi:glycosyltransferase family 2 protein [Frankia sp. Cj3]|uniref:glycosyltransferase family 2 protein n=1 Tax=Frankia sp. Cj3 TaxID=2880976 RepID=UPI001EF46B24|nr:glycosyltransferase family 2 protein [Frankia sp. Cj3]